MRLLPGQLRIFLDVAVDALDQGVLQSFPYGLFTPGQVLLPGAAGMAVAAIGLRQFQQAFGGICTQIENDILAGHAQGRRQFVVHRQLTGIDDAHGHAGLHRVVEKHGVNRLAHRIVAAEGEGDVADPAGHQGARQIPADETGGVDEVHGVIVVFFHAGRYSENIRIENDVPGLHPRLVNQQFIAAPANFRFALQAIRLALFVEGHHHHRRTIAKAQARLGEKILLSLLHGNGIHHRFALNTLQPRFNDRPAGGIDHDRQPGNIRLRSHQMQESDHGRL